VENLVFSGEIRIVLCSLVKFSRELELFFTSLRKFKIELELFIFRENIHKCGIAFSYLPPKNLEMNFKFLYVFVK